jgi:hypothetical protein
MAGSVIGALRVMLGMDTAQFEKGADRATGRGRKMQSDFTSISANMSKLGLALASAFTGAAAGMAVLVRQSVDVADELSKAASSTGVAVEELSRLRYAADLSGVSFEQLQTGLGRLSRNMYDASQGLAAPARALPSGSAPCRTGPQRLPWRCRYSGDRVQS